MSEEDNVTCGRIVDLGTPELPKGYFVEATIPSGQVRSLDSSDWERMRQVLNGTYQYPEENISLPQIGVGTGIAQQRIPRLDELEKRVAEMQEQIIELRELIARQSQVIRALRDLS